MRKKNFLKRKQGNNNINIFKIIGNNSFYYN